LVSFLAIPSDSIEMGSRDEEDVKELGRVEGTVVAKPERLGVGLGFGLGLPVLGMLLIITSCRGTLDVGCVAGATKATEAAAGAVVGAGAAGSTAIGAG
jgi:hypothetical protein